MDIDLEIYRFTADGTRFTADGTRFTADGTVLL